MSRLTVYFQTEIGIGIEEEEIERIESFTSSDDRQVYLLELLNSRGMIAPISGIIDCYVIED